MIEDVLVQMMDQDLHIGSVSAVKKHLMEEESIDVKEWIIKDIMKKELNLRYKRINQISWQGNADKNKILRQQFAQVFLKIDITKKTVLNIDETWLGMSDFRKFKWSATGRHSSVPAK